MGKILGVVMRSFPSPVRGGIPIPIVGFERDQTESKGCGYQFRRRGYPQLGHQSVLMEFDGLRRDAEDRCDSFYGAALRHQLEDLPLPLSEEPDRTSRLLTPIVDDCHVLGISIECRMNCTDQLIGSLL